MDLHNEVEHDTDPVASRAGEATRKGAQAFARLLQLAEQRSSGQIVRVVGFRHTDGGCGFTAAEPVALGANSWARLAPQIQFAAAPGHCARTETDGAGELLLGDEPVDRRSTQARHLYDGWHAQKHGRNLILCFRGWGRGLLHGNLPVEACRQL